MLRIQSRFLWQVERAQKLGFFYLRPAGKNIRRNDKVYGSFLENVGRSLGLTSGKEWVLKLSGCKYACPGKKEKNSGKRRLGSLDQNKHYFRTWSSHPVLPRFSFLSCKMEIWLCHWRAVMRMFLALWNVHDMWNLQRYTI